MVSQQLQQEPNRQGFDAACEANGARPDARGVEFRKYACLTPELLPNHKGGGEYVGFHRWKMDMDAKAQ